MKFVKYITIIDFINLICYNNFIEVKRKVKSYG